MSSIRQLALRPVSCLTPPLVTGLLGLSLLTLVYRPLSFYLDGWLIVLLLQQAITLSRLGLRLTRYAAETEVYLWQTPSPPLPQPVSEEPTQGNESEQAEVKIEEIPAPLASSEERREDSDTPDVDGEASGSDDRRER